VRERQRIGIVQRKQQQQAAKEAVYNDEGEGGVG
jgi:hypothetical protein